MDAKELAQKNIEELVEIVTDQAKELEEMKAAAEESEAKIKELEELMKKDGPKPIPGKYKGKTFKNGYRKVHVPAGVPHEGTNIDSALLMKTAAEGKQEDSDLSKKEAQEILDKLIKINFGGFK